jgi:hypothetical protein
VGEDLVVDQGWELFSSEPESDMTAGSGI